MIHQLFLSSSKVLTNNQKTLTQASLTRAKDDCVKGTKKSATLAYPEDALITHHAAAKVRDFKSSKNQIPRRFPVLEMKPKVDLSQFLRPREM